MRLFFAFSDCTVNSLLHLFNIFGTVILLVILLFLYLLIFIKRVLKVGKLYSNHQVQNKESSKDDAYQEEYVVSVCVCCFSDLIHNVGPSLQSNDNEDIENRLIDIVERCNTEVWVAPIKTLALNITQVALSILIADNFFSILAQHEL